MPPITRNIVQGFEPPFIKTKDNTSAENSTSTVLVGSASFTARPDDVSAFSTISVLIFSDVASATLGLSMQFSTDGTNWDRTINYTVNASNAQRYAFPVEAQFFRIVYTNGSSPQTEFRLQTIFHPGKILTDEISKYTTFTFNTLGTQAPIRLESWNNITTAMKVADNSILTYSLQIQLDDSGNWFNSSISNAQADAITVLFGKVTNIRINITSFTSGSVTLELLQGR